MYLPSVFKMSLTLQLLLLNVVCVLLFHVPTLHSTPISLIFKDKSTNLFTLSVTLKTPPQPTKLFLDLGFLFPWTVCDANYNSTSLHQIPCTTDFCSTLGFGGLSCTNCSLFNPPNPNCNPNILICGSFPENPVTRDSISDSVLVDTLSLPTTTTHQAPPFTLPNYTFSCAQPSLLKGLPKHVTGLATLSRSKLSLQAQISTSLSTPPCVALCFPSSVKNPGVAIIGSTGPYFSSSSETDLAKLLIYTPLIVNPVSRGDTEITYDGGSNKPSDQYFIGLNSITINNRRVPINESLLNISPSDGFGGTKISTATPFTSLQSSIYKAFMELFVQEAGSSAFNLTVTVPVKPFSVCYNAGDVTVGRVGPRVPVVDLVLHEPGVVWRVLGANSMVRVVEKKKSVDLWCLGFIDGGIGGKTPIVIGGKQLEDNLVLFDLESNRLGFTSSLLSRSISCSDLAPAHLRKENN